MIIIAAYVVFGLWVGALALTVVNLLDTPRLRANGDAPAHSPFLSVIVPARTEADAIGDTVRQFLAQDYPRIELIVVDDQSADGTGMAARDAAPNDNRLTVLSGVDTPSGWLGKPWAMRQGAELARGELLLFADADVRYAPGAVSALAAFRERMGADLVAVLPRLELEGFWEHVLLPQLACFLLRQTPIFLANRTTLPWLAVGGGVGNLVTREAYERCGGHEALCDAVVDDVGLARLVRGIGGVNRVAIGDDLVSIRVYRGLRQIVDGFTKNLYPLFGHFGTLSLGGFWLVAHVGPYVTATVGLVRIAGGAPMGTAPAIGLATVGLITLSRVILFRRLGYRLDSAIFGEVPMILGWCYIMARSAWQVGVRKRLSWRGRDYSTAVLFGRDGRRRT